MRGFIHVLWLAAAAANNIQMSIAAGESSRNVPTFHRVVLLLAAVPVLMQGKWTQQNQGCGSFEARRMGALAHLILCIVLLDQRPHRSISICGPLHFSAQAGIISNIAKGSDDHKRPRGLVYM